MRADDLILLAVAVVTIGLAIRRLGGLREMFAVLADADHDEGHTAAQRDTASRKSAIVTPSAQITLENNYRPAGRADAPGWRWVRWDGARWVPGKSEDRAE